MAGLEGPCSLYIHIPFCAGTCDYCDFYSIPVKAEDPRLDHYVDALLADAEYILTVFGIRRVPTLYIGGGTPSLLGGMRIARLLVGLGSLMPNSPLEITVEANPESADGSFLEACRVGGVTRISLGVQTFHEPSRRLVHRVGEGALLPERLRLVREYFGAAFSADLITGLPGQDREVLAGDLEKLLSFTPGHISLYALTPGAGTPLVADPRFKTFLPPVDEADRLWLMGRDTLERAGYGQYEVSNFALSGKESLHNIRYWRMENWLGLGPAASGTIIDDRVGRGTRYTVMADVDAYLDTPVEDRIFSGDRALSPLKKKPLILVESLDRIVLMKETCLMGFRSIEGPDPQLFIRRFGRDIATCIPGTLARWWDRGLVRPDKVALTREGLLFLDPFLMDCFEELEHKER
ncbi:coproporphyrinogen III oxidase family protein [Treponema sp. TIM-1]|uniref:coproporphyrinogen-III oxidase family protein n=1 Tax=Treponema sp. TIM-1 TaxID=2898417 RepID=UPI00397F8212